MFRITYAVECLDMTIPTSADELFEYDEKLKECFEEFEIEFKTDTKRFYTGWLPRKFNVDGGEDKIYVDNFGTNTPDIECMSHHFRSIVI